MSEDEVEELPEEEIEDTNEPKEEELINPDSTEEQVLTPTVLSVVTVYYFVVSVSVIWL